MNKVTLVHTTPNGDELIAYMARVSNPTNQDNPNSSKLIKYLITHRSFSFQEFSQRYAQIDSLGDPIFPALRRQDLTNRQNSIDDIGVNCQSEWFAEIASLYSQSSRLYKQMLKAGIAKECAREILPLASPTRLYMNGTLRSWIHYCELRTGNGTQKEHRDIALEIKKLIQQNYPQTYEALS